MSKRRKKRLRERGKIKLSRYFQQLKIGQKVSLKKEKAVQKASFPTRFSGRTGTIKAKRGSSYVIEFKDGNLKKQLIIHPIHLSKAS